MRALVGLAAAALLTSPAYSATEIPAKPGKSWKHKATGAQLPAVVAGLERRKVVYFSAPEVDVAGDYWSADGNDTITVYLYRDVTGSVPIWFDRSRHFIMNLPDKYGAVKPAGARPFVPRGQSVASGLVESFEVGKGARSSALAVLPFNGFYAKVRASSKTRDAAELEQLLFGALNAFDWSSKGTAAAAPIADCPAPLPARGPAELFEGTAEDRMMAGILGGLLGAVTAQKNDKDEPQPPPAFCREAGQSNLGVGMYRRAGQDDGYFLAVLDGGRGINVGRNELAELMEGAAAGKSGTAAPAARYSVSFVQLDKVETYGDFTALPLPEQVTAMVENTRPASIAGTWGKKDKEVTIVTD